MKIFPIGNTQTASNFGTLDGQYYEMFEPNAGCKAVPTYSTHLTTFKDQILQTRQKAKPYKVVSYNYENIFDREYSQIEHFTEDVEESLTSFYIVDWSKPRSVNAVGSSGGVWTVHTNDTREYSAIPNQKANRVFIWSGSKFKVGQILSMTTNASIRIDVSSNIGALSNTAASVESRIYPLYECYMQPNSLANFNVTDYWDEDVGFGLDGGYRQTGNIAFVTKYKI